MTIAGEQDVPLENKESVEIVKGIAGVESGVASAGGLINYVTKEPSRATASGHRPGHGSSRHFVRRTRSGPRLPARAFEPGIRLNLAGEDMHTYVQHADGWRGVGAADGELHLGPKHQPVCRFRISTQSTTLGGRLSVAGRNDRSVSLFFRPRCWDTSRGASRIRLTCSMRVRGWSTRSCTTGARS